jgi:hypothetical protein
MPCGWPSADSCERNSRRHITISAIPCCRIKARSLPRFWFYTFYQRDYLRYSFEVLANVRCSLPLGAGSLNHILQSDLRGLIFRCVTVIDGTCDCAYPSSTPETCTVSGADVLDYFEIGHVRYGVWAAILIGITAIYRIACVILSVFWSSIIYSSWRRLYFTLKMRSK